MIDVVLVVVALTCINLNIYLVSLNSVKRRELERLKEERRLTSHAADPMDILAASTSQEESLIWQ